MTKKMNKKIIAIFVIGCFLLTGLTTASATQVETTDLKTNSTATADLTVYIMLGIAFVSYATVTAYNKDTGESYDVEAIPMIPEYQVEGIPVGDYTITATHNNLKTKSKDVTLKEGHNTVYIFTFFNSKSAQPAFFRLINLFPNAFILLRLLLKL